MNREEMREYIQNCVKEQIKTQINEDFGVTVGIIALLVGAGLGAATVASIRKSKQVQEYIDEHLPNYHRELEVLLRKFKYAKSMTDVDAIEKEVDKHIDMLERALSDVDRIVSKSVAGQNVRNTIRKFETHVVKKELKAYIKALSVAFKGRVSSLRQEIDVH